ncbi:DoxX-like family protein [Aureitalea marina]|uniref:DoxX family protein n=1 Tax=Aureitalea marina TaxID=930804 RepID=A0A2S7KNC1_9FLAO|nr:DoxX-like family protein [Aureitalea marina]PQB04112.1 hypothetical protein BST85_03745 [Aureitalea marina]
MYSKNNWLIKAITLSTAFVFAGRAYQFLFFDAPFRALLWDEGIMKPVVEGLFATDWSNYVGSSAVDTGIQLSIRITGWIFVLACLAALTLTKSNRRFNRVVLIIGGILLFGLSALYMKEKFFHYGQFFEYSIQFSMPFLLLYVTHQSFKRERLLFTLKILIAFTFTAHGLYAIGYYPVPGKFIDMTIASLGVNETTARLFLNIAGILDIALAVLIFIPKMARYALAYAAIWGFLTAFARITGTIHYDMLGLTLNQSIYQVVYRLPHGLVPLIAFMLIGAQSAFKTPTKSYQLSRTES